MPAPVQKCLKPAEQLWGIGGWNEDGALCSPVSAHPCRGWSLAKEAFCFLVVSAANQRWEGWEASQLMDLRDHYNRNCAQQLCGFSSLPEITIFPLSLHLSARGYCFRLLVSWEGQAGFVQSDSIFSKTVSCLFHLSWKSLWNFWTFRKGSLW